MEIEVRKEGLVAIVTLPERVDGTNAPALETQLTDIIKGGDNKIVLDCAGMSYISSAGLRAVLIGARRSQEAQGKLCLCAVQPSCMEVLEISGFLSLIDVHDTLDAAQAALA